MMKRSIEVKYPKTTKIPVKETFFKTSVIDNYRWLEDDRSKKTENWINQRLKPTIIAFTAYKYLT